MYTLWFYEGLLYTDYHGYCYLGKSLKWPHAFNWNEL